MRIYHAAVNAKVLKAYNKLYPDREIHVLRAFSHLNDDDRSIEDDPPI